MAVPGSAGVWVATDDDRIADEVKSFGGQVVMTSPDCANGTERCADAMKSLGNVASIIVNLQGDAPLSPSGMIPELVDALVADADAVMATPVVRCSPSLYAHLVDDASAGRVGGTTVVFNRAKRALYFSKRLLPYLPTGAESSADHVHLHLGLYAYRCDALRSYRSAEASRLEEVEGLEQLRFLDLGLPVSVFVLDPVAWDLIELNNPSDVPAIERILAVRGIE